MGFKKQNPLQERNEEKYQNDSWATEIAIVVEKNKKRTSKVGFWRGKMELMLSNIMTYNIK